MSDFKICDKPKPFVKWVGGKRSILKEILPRIPQRINDYYEPFVGGGALFFEITDRARHSHISDLNADLVVSYQIIKTRPLELVDLLRAHEKNHSKEYYDNIRNKQDLIDPVENTARFIYLLATCFNGLYRVNKDNKFNTPIGNYQKPNILDESNIKSVNQILQNTTIKYQDFQKIKPRYGDFVYFDPPYHPTKNNSFTKYVKNGFTEKDQERLRDFALSMVDNGVNVMISNSNTDFIKNIYKKHFIIEEIEAPRVINCKPNERNSITELLITNKY